MLAPLLSLLCCWWRRFGWCECDMGDEATVMEVYDLLLYNYVEDDDAMFRC